MAKDNALYRLAEGPQGGFVITKYDSIGWEVLSNYHMPDAITCECPSGHRDTCRHRQMLPEMLDIINTDKFYRFDDGQIGEFVEGELVFTGKARQPIPFGARPRPVFTEGTENTPLFPPLPEGVTLVSLDKPETLHNTVAEAVGEDPAPFKRRF